MNTRLETKDYFLTFSSSNLVPKSLNLEVVTIIPASYQKYFNALNDINFYGK